jgi:hypothetical protein
VSKLPELKAFTEPDVDKSINELLAIRYYDNHPDYIYLYEGQGMSTIPICKKDLPKIINILKEITLR